MTTAVAEPRVESHFNYKVVVTEKNGRFCLRIDELCLFVWGDTLQNAYQELLQRKQRVIEDARDADLLEQLPEPYAGSLGASGFAARRTRERRLARAIIALVVALAIGVPVGWGISRLGTGMLQLATAVSDVRKGFPRGREFWKVLAANIERAADPSNNVDPETQAKVVAGLHALAERAKPFVDALAPLTEPAQPVSNPGGFVVPQH
ncbi:MAG TPA: hypothetical protein VKV32_03060 [Stellaceae bacterium]|nr:hypothetical protein [Stellaceae bacterium]